MKPPREIGRRILEKISEPARERKRRATSAARYAQFEMNSPGPVYSLCAFDYYRCIFVHIPKTAGISVSQALFGNYSGGHRDIRWYQGHYRPATFRRYFKFSFVRNPWDRLYSAYRFLQQGGFHEADATWFRENIGRFASFSEFVAGWLSEENVRYGSIHFRPQVDFLRDREGRLGVDFLGRYESLARDFEVIKREIGSNATLPHLNATPSRDHHLDQYTRETAAVVERVYQADIEAFGYTFHDIWRDPASESTHSRTRS
jgi:hypothetical protein